MDTDNIKLRLSNTKSKISSKFKNIKFPPNSVFAIAFLIPMLIMIIIYIGRQIYPLGPNCFLRTDMYHQYAPFFSEFYGKLKSGGSLSYSWDIGLGVNFTALYAYYLASPINWFIFLCPKDYIIEFMSIVIILKIGLSSLLFSIYLSKHFNTKNMNIIIFSIFYGLSSYMAAYSWNIMWLDCMVLLPIIVLGLENLVKYDRCFLYCISLGITIMSNYYISIMICIFLIFYFFILIFLLPRTDTYKPKYIKKFINFGVFSALAGGFAAFLILPEFFALQLSTSGNIDFPDKLSTYFSLFDMISRHFMNIEASVLSGNFPNIYCGVIVLLMFPLYIFNKEISTKEKVFKLALLTFLAISFNMNILNFIWHGFHFPNSLPCRQSFIYIFLILAVAYEAFDKLDYNSDKQIYGTFAGTIIFALLVEKLIDNYNFSVIYLSLLFLGIYILFIYLYRNQKLRKGILMFLIIAVISVEAGINTEATSVSTTNRANYLKDTNSITRLANKITDLDKDFFRIEKLYRRTKNDTAWHNIKGVSLFSSTASKGVTDFLGDLGFMHSTNAYSYEGATPLTTAILSVKYLIGREQIENNDLLTLHSKDDETYLYKNNYWLPLGFIVNKKLETLPSTVNNPFMIQNDFVNRATNDAPIFLPIETSTADNVTTIYNDRTQNVYIYVQSTNVEKIKVIYDGNTKEYNLDKKQQIVDLGLCEKNKILEVQNSEAGNSLKIASYGFSEENFKVAFQNLNKYPLKIDYFDDTNIRGSVNADKDGILYTSIPYEEGWTVRVDFEEVEPIIFKEAFIMLDIKKGEHYIEFEYTPKGLKAGGTISIACIIIFIAIFVINKAYKYTESDIDRSK